MKAKQETSKPTKINRSTPNWTLQYLRYSNSQTRKSKIKNYNKKNPKKLNFLTSKLIGIWQIRRNNNQSPNNHFYNNEFKLRNDNTNHNLEITKIISELKREKKKKVSGQCLCELWICDRSSIVIVWAWQSERDLCDWEHLGDQSPPMRKVRID